MGASQGRSAVPLYNQNTETDLEESTQVSCRAENYVYEPCRSLERYFPRSQDLIMNENTEAGERRRSDGIS